MIRLAKAEQEGCGCQPIAVPRPWWFAVAAIVVILPIFAHGCHRGDHDDEPLFVPMDHRMQPDAPQP